MMPDEWPSMRSMARWVLPVLVGPSTAVTPAPRALEPRLVEEEKEMGINGRKLGDNQWCCCWMQAHSAAGAAKLSRIVQVADRVACSGIGIRSSSAKAPRRSRRPGRYMLPPYPANTQWDR